jgi:peptidoglycan/LPS O-acetylase OafA/YrhL
VRDGAAPAGLVWALTLIAALGVSAALAWMLHVLVEKPALALRDRFAR